MTSLSVHPSQFAIRMKYQRTKTTNLTVRKRQTYDVIQRIAV